MGRRLRKSRDMTLEQQALLGAKDVRGSRFESPYFSDARMLDVPVSSSDINNTSSVQQPDGNPAYVEGLPIWRAALLVVNSALGAGILNFPQAYAQCGGIATAFTIQMVGVFLGCRCVFSNRAINKYERNLKPSFV